MAILIWPIENSTECTSDYRRQNRNYKNRNAVANVIYDITRQRVNEKQKNSLMTYEAMGCGYNLPAVDIIQEFVYVQNVYDIDKRKGRRMCHELLSLTNEEVMALNFGYNLLLGVARDCARWYFEQGYQVVFAIHHQGKWHIHFAVNSINYRDGRKFHTTKKEMQERQWLFNSILNKYILMAQSVVAPIYFENNMEAQ